MKNKKTLVIFSLILMILLSSACTVNDSTVGNATSDPSNPTEQDQAAHSDDSQKPADAIQIKDSGLKGVVDGLPVPSLEGKTIGISVIGTQDNNDRQAFQGQIDRVKELGGTPIAVDGERNDQKTIADIENLITQKPDAIIKHLGDTKVFTNVLKKVKDAKIPLFTIDHPSEYSNTNHMSDNYYMGEALARQLFEDIGGEGKVAVFNGFYGVQACRIRYDLLKYVAQDYPKVQFIEPELQDVIPGTIEDARKKIQDLLLKYPQKGDLRAVWACWDIPGIGAAQAIDAAGRKDIKVYGADGEPAALDLVADPSSSFTAIAAQEPYKVGQAAVDTAARFLAGQAVPKTVYLDAFIVTKENVAEARKKLEPK
ncbi:sugar ABC transporter substrate-binding protein [Paenibacillus naphthalenovorans]|uniref:sugar ABC transporter substrate-binding protein n=1 Tax=Paenibacillus naphthalenovorans TaxID=162209 RepID=UPI0010BC2DBF|nr:sugar ABC transporter substrate-binding protein [Paenibacillus naphthalenovorans]GCL74278.1 sugar ABC transporter substrate-binding protein [Paenibacillus naphthalenovorans]